MIRLDKTEVSRGCSPRIVKHARFRRNSSSETINPPVCTGIQNSFGDTSAMRARPSPLRPQVGRRASEFSGMVWERHGDWHLNGSSTTLRLGEAIPPGGLVTGSAESSAHSMTILLPDGQRMLCECYEAKTCSQGFRVPAITPQPRPAVWDMFVGVRNVLLLRPATAETAFPTRRAVPRWRETSRSSRPSARRVRSRSLPRCVFCLPVNIR